MKYLIAFIIAFVLVYVLIPPLKKLALKIDFVDRPTSRKIHKEPVPHLAGIAIVVSFVATYLIFLQKFTTETIAIVIGSLMVLAIGLVDDWFKTRGKDFPALPKLIIQIAAAIIAYKAGIVFHGFTNPITREYILLPETLQFILSVTWIFGVTTVINFVDGLDGLAGGISAISAGTLFIVALTKGQLDSAMMSIILVGVLIGYLKYNKHPAEIYMGDAGATFIGYMLGIIALDGAFKQVTIISLFVPVLALGVPIFDNLFVIIKRMIDGKPVYKADRSQVHYRLLSAGLKPKQVVVFLCLVNFSLSLVSIILLLLTE